MSILTDQYPTIEPHELNICLLSTSSAFDAFTLPKLFERLPLEPRGRDAVKLCAVLQDPWLLTSDKLLIEDIMVGLCEPLARLWGYCNLVRRGGPVHGGSKFELLGCLAAWKARLDSISYLCESAGLGEEATEFPLRAYCAGESESSAAALRRARSLVQEAAILHRLLSLHLHADLQALDMLVADLRRGEQEHAANNERQLRVREWARSADGRTAVGLAVAVLEEALAQDTGLVLPLADVALSAGSVVMRAWIEHATDDICRCPPATDAQARPRETLDFRDLIPSMKNPMLGRIAVCKCTAQDWEHQFRIAQQHVKGQPLA